MRKCLSLLVALGLLLPAPGFAASDGIPSGKEVVLTVRGMVCASCSRVVEQALRKLDGVMEARVDMRKDTVLVKYDEKKVTPQKMVEALRKAGYQAKLPVR